MCFEYYTGPNKYESAVEYVEARFRAHFQQSRILARKTREIAEHPHLHKIRKPEESSNEDQEANKAKWVFILLPELGQSSILYRVSNRNLFFNLSQNVVLAQIWVLVNFITCKNSIFEAGISKSSHFCFWKGLSLSHCMNFELGHSKHSLLLSSFPKVLNRIHCKIPCKLLSSQKKKLIVWKKKKEITVSFSFIKGPAIYSEKGTWGFPISYFVLFAHLWPLNEGIGNTHINTKV